MQLLHCRPLPTAEFASLSILLKSDSSEGSSSMGDSLSVTSPFTTIPLSLATGCVRELHEYVNSVYEITQSNSEVVPSNNKNDGEDDGGRGVVDQLLLDDSTVLGGNPIHVFRPSQGHGVALHYAVVMDDIIVQKCASVVLHEPSGSKGGARNGVESAVGIILCLGVSGLTYAQSSSAPLYAMTSRMRDCMGILERLISLSDQGECQASVKSMLSTLLLTDDEERKTNAMVDAEMVTIKSDMEGDTSNDKIKSAMSPMGAVRKTKRGQGKRTAMKDDSTGASDIRLMVTAASSADMARITAERLAVLSVAEKESQLRKYESTGVQRRNSMTFGKPKSRIRRRKAGHEADLEDFDCPMATNKKQQEVPALRPPGVDTLRQISPEKPSRISPKKAALPTLLAPRNDVASKRANQNASRRWGLGSNRSRRGADLGLATSASLDVAPQREAAFNAFAVETGGNDAADNNTFFPGLQMSGVNDEQYEPNGASSNHMNGGDPWGMITAARTTEFNTTTPRESANETSPGFDPFSPVDMRPPAPSYMLSTDAASPSSRPPKSPRRNSASLDEEKRQPTNDTSTALQRLLAEAGATGLQGLTDDEMSRGDQSALSYPNGEWMTPLASNSELRKAYNELDELVAMATPAESNEESVDLPARLLVNVALNEDLTCSYRQSKMSSCTIEGVVQVQVTCDAGDGVPFFLLVRDPSRHIKMVQENRRFAEDMTQALSEENPDDMNVDYKFTVSVPSADNYFPVMRYKCSSELRPVPIRVQTRVRVNDTASCRVALQISSNPANEDDLTDLTIVMGVPMEVRGETLTTTPPGGVWNASKRSVIWCVAELGDGEKFQLQAEFQMNPAHPPASAGDKPKFPVLVRCQCMYAQLSDVELEISDIPDVFPADVAMKLARRFRLSHRERS